MHIPDQQLSDEQRAKSSLFDSLFSQVTRFNSLFDARSFARTKKLVVLQGDWPFYWVARRSIADQLVEMGYERVGGPERLDV